MHCNCDTNVFENKHTKKTLSKPRGVNPRNPEVFIVTLTNLTKHEHSPMVSFLSIVNVTLIHSFIMCGEFYNQNILNEEKNILKCRFIVTGKNEKSLYSF